MLGDWCSGNEEGGEHVLRGKMRKKASSSNVVVDLALASGFLISLDIQTLNTVHLSTRDECDFSTLVGEHSAASPLSVFIRYNCHGHLPCFHEICFDKAAQSNYMCTL